MVSPVRMTLAVVLLAFVLAVSAQNIPTPEVRWFTQTVSQRRTRSEISFFTDKSN